MMSVMVPSSIRTPAQAGIGPLGTALPRLRPVQAALAWPSLTDRDWGVSVRDSEAGASSLPGSKGRGAEGLPPLAGLLTRPGFLSHPGPPHPA